MAKFINKDLRLKDGQNVTFGDGLDANLVFDGTEFGVDTTMSGVYPTQDYHLTTKQYVDNVATQSGSISHSALLNLDADDHQQYSLTSGTRDYTGVVQYNDNKTFTNDTDIVAKKYVDDAITTATASGAIDHGLLAGLGDDDHQIYHTDGRALTWLGTRSIADIGTRTHSLLTARDQDDHTQYSLVNGARAFTSTVGGITPTAGTDLTTKDYVDAAIQGLYWQDPIIDFVPVASGTTTSGNRYVASATGGGWTINNIYEYNGSSWDETVPLEGYAAWFTNLDKNYTYNGSSWVAFGSTVDHGNLSGLGDDDHTQYPLVAGTRDFTGIVQYDAHKVFAADTDIVDKKYVDDEIDTATASGAIDHGLLAGLGDDDHPQYLDNARGDVRYLYKENVSAFTPDSDYEPSTKKYVDDSITTLSGVLGDHGNLVGLGDDDHTQYSLADGTRAFTGEVAGIDPTVSGSLATKHYVDSQDELQTTIYEHGRQAIGDGVSTVSVVFDSALTSTNYTINCTMENASDSPPSIYAFIVSAKATTGFTCSLIGDTDSANYVMNWSVIS